MKFTQRGGQAATGPADRFMAHVAVPDADDEGKVVTWLDQVSAEEHGA